MAVNLVIPAVYFESFEAKLTLACFLAAFITGLILYKIQGYTYLLGLMHVYWFPLVLYLICRIQEVPLNGPFGIWLVSLIVLNSISLVFDVMDVGSFIIFKNRHQLR